MNFQGHGPLQEHSVRREYPEAPIVGVGAVVIEGAKVLLVRRGHEPLKGEWSLPGGALELGETLPQGVVREVLEETGLEVVPAGIVEVFDRITRDEATGRIRYHYVLVDFVCRVAGGTLLGASDAEEARWVERDELHAQGEYRVAPFTVQVIEKAFGVLSDGTRLGQ
jgi:8-oxo-dGTP diphosphatase